MPSSDVLPQLSKAYVENARWLMGHLSQVLRAHPNQWVAVQNQRVVAADADLGVVTASAARSGPPSDTVYQFVE
jgi:hypothetical protein